MTNIEIAKTILKYVGQDSIEVDRALCAGVILLLDGQDATEQAKTEQTEPEQPEKISAENFQGRVKQRRGGRKPFDTGKMKALLKAGWSIAKIADEMGVTEATIRKHCKEEGLLKDETTGV